MQKRDYKVMTDAWVGGVYRKEGDKIQLTEAEAKYLVLSGVLTLDKPKTASAPAVAKKDVKAD